jgi:glutamyl-tRNA reductase
MDRIAILGASLHETDVAGLGRLARPDARGFEAFARALADELAASELVLLATCNRVEVIYARELGHLPSDSDRGSVARRLGLPDGDPLGARMHFHAGGAAVRHLFRVACSLDSVVVGEDQILAQCRDAYAAAERAGLVGRILGTVFEQAFQVGKQVRTETDLSRIPVSVVSLGLDEIARRFEGAKPRIAVIGAGTIADLAARGASDQGMTVAVVANRGLARAQALAARCGAAATTVERFLADPGGVDAIVSATSAPGIVLGREALLAFAGRTPSGRPLVAVDLAVPRDVEPVDDARVTVIDIDRLRAAAASNLALRAAAAARAEALVQAKLEAFVRRATQSKLDEALADVRNESQSVFENELSHLFTGKLARLGPEERRAIELWARAAFGRVNHVPIRAIKRLASDATLFGGAARELP